MGQRLVITIRNHNRDLAKIYYHWSAYTRSALEEARELIHHIQQYGKVCGENEVYPIRCFSCGAMVPGNKCEHCGTPYHGHSISEKDFQLMLIRFCEGKGGGISGSGDERDVVQQMFPDQSFKTDHVDRNNGLIALSRQGMNTLGGWSEGDMWIDLDRNSLQNCVLYAYDSVAEYNSARMEWDDWFVGFGEEEIPELEYDPAEIPFDHIDNVCMEMESLTDTVYRRGHVVYELMT